MGYTVTRFAPACPFSLFFFIARLVFPSLCLSLSSLSFFVVVVVFEWFLECRKCHIHGWRAVGSSGCHGCTVDSFLFSCSFSLLHFYRFSRFFLLVRFSLFLPFFVFGWFLERRKCHIHAGGRRAARSVQMHGCLCSRPIPFSSFLPLFLIFFPWFF